MKTFIRTMMRKGALRSPSVKIVDKTLSQKHLERGFKLQELKVEDSVGNVLQADTASLTALTTATVVKALEALASTPANKKRFEQETFQWVDADNKVIELSVMDAIGVLSKGVSETSTLFIPPTKKNKK